MKPHRVEWFWVKGHAGHVENERADALARAGIAEARAAAALDAEPPPAKKRKKR